MAAESVIRAFSESLNTFGRLGLSSLYPNDFEYYMVALELTDSDGNLIDYLTFPVTPESIQKVTPNRTNIKKTNRGVTVLSSPSPMPSEITLRGNFGKKFKFIIAPKDVSVSGYAFSFDSGKKDLYDLSNRALSLKTPSFSFEAKTGYGAIKILESILIKSSGVGTNGKPFRLYLYNMALGESYLVAVNPSGVTLSQDVSKNEIWSYSVSFSVLAPLSAAQSQFKTSSLSSVLSRSGVQKSIYSLSSLISSL